MSERDDAKFFDPVAPLEISRANLPHWRQEGVTRFLTFRLVDSLPEGKLEHWRKQREAWLAEHPEPISEVDQRTYHELFSDVVEGWLDQGTGSSVLELPECRRLVEEALRFFDGDRYQLGEWVVASNHVHVLVRPRPGHEVSEILHSWKSFTSKALLKMEEVRRRLQPWWDRLNARRRGAAFERSTARFHTMKDQRPIWQKESFDHLVRSAASLEHFERYIRSHRR